MLCGGYFMRPSNNKQKSAGYILFRVLSDIKRLVFLSWNYLGIIFIFCLCRLLTFKVSSFSERLARCSGPRNNITWINFLHHSTTCQDSSCGSFDCAFKWYTHYIFSGGSTISQRACVNLLFDKIFPNYSQKLHENKENLGERGGARLCPPLRSATDFSFQSFGPKSQSILNEIQSF